MVSFKQWQPEQAVKGWYYGVPFTGTLATSPVNRDGTFNHTTCRQSPGRAFIFVVKLSSPMVCMGRERLTVEVWDNDDNELHLV